MRRNDSKKCAENKTWQKNKTKNETTKLTTCAGNFCKLLLTENIETWYNFDFWIGSSFFPRVTRLIEHKGTEADQVV